MIPDTCGCCQICARSEGELCDQRPKENRFGICGENLKCVRREDEPQVHSYIRIGIVGNAELVRQRLSSTRIFQSFMSKIDLDIFLVYRNEFDSNLTSMLL